MTSNHLLNQLITALGKDKNLNLTGEEIADILWLTIKRWESEEIGSDAILQQPTPSPQLEEKISPLSNTTSTNTQETHPATANIYPESSKNRHSSSTEAIPLGVPDAPSLRESLKLAQALKPLMRWVASGKEMILDEITTADRTAALGICVPVFKPEPEPWLDLALVVDESKSMLIWRHTIWELKRLLEHYGIFRDVRTWGLVVDDNGEVALRPGMTTSQQRNASHREIIDPSSSRLVLVVSDCVAAIWRNGKVTKALQDWAFRQPVAIIQMLPEWLWQRTGLSLGASVLFESSTPGVANQHLLIKELLLWQEIHLDTGVKVPVLTLEPEVAVTWSQMVAGKSGAVAAGFVFSAELSVDAQPPAENSIRLDAKERVYRFRMTASPMARKLAGLLAAALVINLPVVRLIQETMLPQSRQVHVAEVFLGGLLKPLTPIEADTNSDAVQYDFMDDEIRNILLESAPVGDSAEVLNQVSQYIAKQLGKSLQEFVALLKAPGQNDEDVQPFAVVAVKVLKQLGGDYARFAEELEKGQSPNPPYEGGHQTPAWRQQHQKPSLTYALNLQRFEFEVVTVNHHGEIIQKETRQAQYFTEDLGNGTTLDMVAIPGGTFLMGSPEGEGYESEKPQHEVTVQPFFMGKYPVTQAQWKAVAALPQVERELEPEPSHFKGSDHPVENISWDDAVEFCARLSKETGKNYRLASEAEWEYACRAGTTTPFYFGETITTDLVNFNGKPTYDGEQEGENREETTSVGNFPPNHFGLYDMHGNVWEWCDDCWHENYNGAPTDGSSWIDSNENDNRMLRGGSWIYYAVNCRSAIRFRDVRDYRNDDVGFRVVLPASS